MQNEVPLDDPELGARLDKARAGCQESLGELLEGCRKYLLLIANEELPADIQAKIAPSDLVQDTFVKAREGIDLFRGRSEDELRAWLRQILRNSIQDATRYYLRAERRSVRREVPLKLRGEEPLDDGTTPSELLDRQETRQRLAELLERMPADYQNVIRWRHFERRSFADIGADLGKSANAACKLWMRAIETLAAELERSGLHGQTKEPN